MGPYNPGEAPRQCKETCTGQDVVPKVGIQKTSAQDAHVRGPGIGRLGG